MGGKFHLLHSQSQAPGARSGGNLFACLHRCVYIPTSHSTQRTATTDPPDVSLLCVWAAGREGFSVFTFWLIVLVSRTAAGVGMLRSLSALRCGHPGRCCMLPAPSQGTSLPPLPHCPPGLGPSGHLCLLQVLRHSLDISLLLSLMLEEVSFYLCWFAIGFCHEWMLNIVKDFSMMCEMIMWFFLLKFVNMVKRSTDFQILQFINLYWFSRLKLESLASKPFLGNNPAYLWCSILFTYSI